MNVVIFISFEFLLDFQQVDGVTYNVIIPCVKTSRLNAVLSRF